MNYKKYILSLVFICLLFLVEPIQSFTIVEFNIDLKTKDTIVKIDTLSLEYLVQKNKNLAKKKKKNTETSFTFLPYGTHTRKTDLIYVWYTGYNYKNFELAAFRNSYKELTLAVFHKTKLPITDKFSVILGTGLMHGYKGRLSNVEGIPFRKSFLFTGPINPAMGLEIDYRLSKRISFHSNVSQVVFIYGLKYHLHKKESSKKLK